MFTMYRVGGCVRDQLMGLKPKDIDYVAVTDPIIFGRKVSDNIEDAFDVLVNYLKNYNFEIFLETRACYTIRAKFPKDHINAGQVADFVLARKEIGYKSDTREPIVVPGTLYDDLQRRDFTVNAIAQDADGGIYDPFKGVDDIKKRILRTPISGQITFADDPLRLLRAIRFSITKSFHIHDDIEYILKHFDYEHKFFVVSTERIREELLKCFKYSTPTTLSYLTLYWRLADYIFQKTELWLKPTSEL